ncbi:hypothetical protein D9611_005652 [Ephemerocybe angulata]|uniref:TEL2-interacting protein 1 n=1 Tax=Ephemerocybe angulata TaxID=980116 RepID=A0A8H5BHT1_9AGAR|nr:hypothetical protein D9611_005652 [Tulosesus angulatus]
MTSTEGQAQFQRFKAICVPILSSSKLTPSTIPAISSLLSQLIQGLRDLDPVTLTPSFISYVFFPLSSILQRNLSSEIPDQILEKVLIALGILSENWWWTCELKIFEQVFMLCGAVVGGLESKGKERARDEETKEAAIRCILSLLHKRTPEDATARSLPASKAEARAQEIQNLLRSPKFVPIIGQTIDSVLGTAASSRLSLQQSSLDLLALILESYAPEDLIPTVLPGVASTMTKVALGVGSSKGWTNGLTVAGALKVLRIAVVKAVGDDVCMKEGALPKFEDLEDLANFSKSEEAEPSLPTSTKYGTARTPSWLRGTTSQLHMAINTLNPLVKHPTPSALYALVDFSSEIIATTALTLPHTQPLLISFLLSLSNSEYPKVRGAALQSLRDLLSSSNRSVDLLQMVMQMTSQNLASLPRFLASQSDAKTQHVAEMVIAICRVALLPDDGPALTSISKAIGKLLGPSGGIEKWGWSLLSVLEFMEPSVTIAHTSAEHLMLENNQNIAWVPFPELSLKNVSSRDAKRSLEEMFCALGEAGGDPCLFSVEWFTEVGRAGTRSRNVAAMWCACRLLEGLGKVSLMSDTYLNDTMIRRSKRVEKRSRELARTITELWDKSDFNDLASEAPLEAQGNEDFDFNVQHQKGLVPLHETLQIFQSRSTKEQKITDQPIIHRGLCLQLIAITAGILQSRFNSLFIFALYPILHSIVSPAPFISSTGLATLNYVTIATSYASPSNLLLSNFDYALDSVSRRLTRRWLDIDATKVLVILVRLVGPEVVAKAGDVVEECFDRLDAFHGYGIIVDGLIEVLTEVLNVIEIDVKANLGSGPKREKRPDSEGLVRLKTLGTLFQWLPARNVGYTEEETTNYGPAPREAWGPPEEEGDGPTIAEARQGKAEEAPPTPSQSLTKQIIARSLYFLTHDSPVIRARILLLLSLAVPVLPQSALLPSIHDAWPFILNRLKDPETFIVAAAANLVDVLVTHVGSFMYRKVWDDVWPRFQAILKQLELGDRASALSRRGRSAVGTESAYTHSHRLYRSLLRSMTGVMQGVHPHEPSYWDCLVLLRRFLGQDVQEELQTCAKEFYVAAGERNSDAVWLVLEGTFEDIGISMKFMCEDRWRIEPNAREVIGQLEG